MQRKLSVEEFKEFIEEGEAFSATLMQMVVDLAGDGTAKQRRLHYAIVYAKAFLDMMSFDRELTPSPVDRMEALEFHDFMINEPKSRQVNELCKDLVEARADQSLMTFIEVAMNEAIRQVRLVPISPGDRSRLTPIPESDRTAAVSGWVVLGHRLDLTKLMMQDRAPKLRHLQPRRPRTDTNRRSRRR